MGWIPQKIETRSKVRGLEDSEQKTLNFIVMQALSQDVQLSSLMLDGFFCEFGVWRTEGDLELERSTNGCQGLR